MKPSRLCFPSHSISGPTVSKKQIQLRIFLPWHPYKLPYGKTPSYLLLVLVACQQIIPLWKRYYIFNSLNVYFIIFWVVLEKFSKLGPYYDSFLGKSWWSMLVRAWRLVVLSGLWIWVPAQSVLSIMGTTLCFYTNDFAKPKEISIINSWASGLHLLRSFRKLQRSSSLKMS